MKTALAYDVDEGECLDIQTLLGPVTFQAKECGNTWGFYKGGQEKGRGKEVQATGSHSAAASEGAGNGSGGQTTKPWYVFCALLLLGNKNLQRLHTR